MLLRAWNAPGTDACARSPAACCTGPQAGRGGRFLRNRNRPQFGRQDRIQGQDAAAARTRPRDGDGSRQKCGRKNRHMNGRTTWAGPRQTGRDADGGHSSARAGRGKPVRDKRGRGRRHEGARTWRRRYSHRRAGREGHEGRTAASRAQHRRRPPYRAGRAAASRCATRTAATVARGQGAASRCGTSADAGGGTRVRGPGADGAVTDAQGAKDAKDARAGRRQAGAGQARPRAGRVRHPLTEEKTGSRQESFGTGLTGRGRTTPVSRQISSGGSMNTAKGPALNRNQHEKNGGRLCGYWLWTAVPAPGARPLCATGGRWAA